LSLVDEGFYFPTKHIINSYIHIAILRQVVAESCNWIEDRLTHAF